MLFKYVVTYLAQKGNKSMEGDKKNGDQKWHLFEARLHREERDLTMKSLTHKLEFWPY